jgi:hypothetical protein
VTGEPGPEPDPIGKRWLPEGPWRPPLPSVPEVQAWECRVCGAVGCLVPGCTLMDAGGQHIETEHADVVAAMLAAEKIGPMSTTPEQQEHLMDEHGQEFRDPIPDAEIGKLIDTEKLKEAVRQLSRSLQPAVDALMEEGWTEVQAREMVLILFRQGQHGRA